MIRKVAEVYDKNKQVSKIYYKYRVFSIAL